MKYRYRNRKTGEEITTSNRVNGKNWEPVEEKIPKQPLDEDPFEDGSMMGEDPAEETPEEETVAEETPVGKTKTSRRSKK